MSHAIRQRATRAAYRIPPTILFRSVGAAAAAASSSSTTLRVSLTSSSPTPSSFSSCAFTTKSRNSPTTTTTTRPSSNNTTTPTATSHGNCSSETTTAHKEESEGPPLNPPTSTLPPPLNLPIRLPETSTIKHLFATGKAYLLFYKAGLGAVLSNFRAVKTLLSVPIPSSSSSSRPPSLILTRQRGPAPTTWTRADWLLYRRARHDIFRMPIFGLMLLVFDELTPLAVWLFSGLVPLTCRIPKQVVEDEAKAEGRRRMSFSWLEMRRYEGRDKAKGGDGVGDEMALLRAAGFEKGGGGEDGGMKGFMDLGLNKAKIHATKSLGLVGSKWDVVLGVSRMPPGTWWLKGLPKMSFLEVDDEFLRRGGVPFRDVKQHQQQKTTRSKGALMIGQDVIGRAIKGLSDPEVRLACKDRGIDVSTRTAEESRMDLVRWLWLTGGKEHDERRRRMSALIMTRFKDWPETRDFELPDWYI